ncbi:hypothetical protein SAY86_018742 [Trapa natans]|uniref:BZIP domain-containing protein n=1 Tax=Trapa natans TaxID=22666 RepID=A0AAN7LGT9_TRANT|nr:hypothetical protein SAY86_018742 [Trapa natans]
MDSNMNFGGGANPLTRQTSIYSLTVDEFQRTWSGIGKDFGSMNMDELLKSIWNAEETQAVTSNGGGAGQGGIVGVPGSLQKQGSLTLPRTLSQKTVDEVWKDLFKENEGLGNGAGGEEAVSNLPLRQRTLGEMTLEEFLVRAGAVKEETQTQQVEMPIDGGFYGHLPSTCNNIAKNNAGLALSFLQQSQKNGLVAPVQNPNLASVQDNQPSQCQQQLLFLEPTTMGFASPVNPLNLSQLVSNPAKSMTGITEPSNCNSVIQLGGIMKAGIGAAVPTGMGSSVTSHISPAVSNNTVDSLSASPVPCAFSQGRKPNVALEKVVERRQRRMIKNRESAARSRARKQAYTLELEAEIAKLKELNQELQKKQDKFMEMQKNQILQTVNGNLGNKRLCLRRTLTGPW